MQNTFLESEQIVYLYLESRICNSILKQVFWMRPLSWLSYIDIFWDSNQIAYLSVEYRICILMLWQVFWIRSPAWLSYILRFWSNSLPIRGIQNLHYNILTSVLYDVSLLAIIHVHILRIWTKTLPICGVQNLHSNVLTSVLDQISRLAIIHLVTESAHILTNLTCRI